MNNRPSALELVFSASTITLEAVELARRNEAAQLARQIKTLIWHMAETLADADLCHAECQRRREGGTVLDSSGPAPEGRK